MSFSSDVTAGDIILATQYNNLRKDVFDVFSGHNHTTELRSVFVGNNAGNSTISGFDNTFIGYDAGKIVNTGKENIFIGAQSGASNTTGFQNTFIGYESGKSNITGLSNVFLGHQVGIINTGSDNTFVGVGSGISNTTGHSNTFIGRNAGINHTTGQNNICIGLEAMTLNNTGNNQVRIGNTNISYAGIQVAWTITSDKRYKEDIKDLNLGINFINQLKPVEYKRIKNERNEKEFGLIAQDLEKILIENKIENTGLLTKDDKGYMSIRYNDLIPVLIKGMQEQQKQIEELKQEIRGLK